MFILLVTYGRHSVAGEWLEYWVVLYVWCNDDHVTSEVQGKGVTFPVAMYFDDIEGESMEEVFECCADIETVGFEVIETE